jgi:hypothetical protein
MVNPATNSVQAYRISTVGPAPIGAVDPAAPQPTVDAPRLTPQDIAKAGTLETAKPKAGDIRSGGDPALLQSQLNKKLDDGKSGEIKTGDELFAALKAGGDQPISVGPKAREQFAAQLTEIAKKSPIEAYDYLHALNTRFDKQQLSFPDWKDQRRNDDPEVPPMADLMGPAISYMFEGDKPHHDGLSKSQIGEIGDMPWRSYR